MLAPFSMVQIMAGFDLYDVTDGMTPEAIGEALKVATPAKEAVDSLASSLPNAVDPNKGAAMLGRASVAIDSVYDLLAAKRDTSARYFTRGYHPSSDIGKGEFYWDPDRPKSAHTGGNIISPTVPWDGTPAGLRNFLAGTGETAPGTSGCFVRPVQPFYWITEFGAIPDWDDAVKTGYDNKWVIEKCVKSVQSTGIPDGDFAVGAAGSVFIQGYSNKIITGPGRLHKTGSAGIFSFNACDSILVYRVKGDGNLAWDEANYGSILDSSRAANRYSFFANFNACSNVEVVECEVDSFSWDGIVQTNAVAVGGATATQSKNVRFDRNKVTNVRGTMLWMKAVKGFSMSGNTLENDDQFIQKANAIFAVEWCHDGLINDNIANYIGDNAIGVGEMLNHTANAVNDNIKISRNLIDTTRYHSILIAQGKNIDVFYNTIKNAGVKNTMPGNSELVLCGAITLKGGNAVSGVAQPNVGVRVHNNTIINPYEFGIYAYDDTTADAAYASDDLSICYNRILFYGTAVFPQRLDSGGIRTQLRKPPRVKGNTALDGVGDGIRVFGDAWICWNTIKRVTGKGIHFPNDTLFSNKQLTKNPSNNTVEDCTSAGISVWGKNFVSLTMNQARRCGYVPTGTETSTDAFNMSGIGTWNCIKSEFIDNECEANGGPGIFSNLSQRVDIRGGYLDNNGAILTPLNFKANAYASGTDATHLVDVTAFMVQMRGGVNASYALRVLFGNASTCVAVDCKVEGHPNGTLGAAVKSLINIP